MVRGRRENPDAPKSRQLEISRAFRQRRAMDLAMLKEKVDQLERDNRELREQNSRLRELLQGPESPYRPVKEERAPPSHYTHQQSYGSANGSSQTFSHSPSMRTDLDRASSRVKEEESTCASSSSASSSRTTFSSPSPHTPLHVSREESADRHSLSYKYSKTGSDGNRYHAFQQHEMQARPQLSAPHLLSQFTPPPVPSNEACGGERQCGPSSCAKREASPMRSSLPPATRMAPRQCGSSSCATTSTVPVSAPPLPPSLPSATSLGPSATATVAALPMLAPDDQAAWERSVRAVGGDPSQCCAGFFQCDENGKIVIPQPPLPLPSSSRV